MTYLSDTALSLEIHLVVGSLQESQLRKKMLKSVVVVDVDDLLHQAFLDNFRMNAGKIAVFKNVLLSFG